MMGISRSSVGVSAENGRPDWSMKMVEDDDVVCQSSEFLSCIVVSSVLLWFWNFYLFMGFY